MKKNLSSLLFLFGAALSLTPWVTSGEALLLGIILALAFGNPHSAQVKKLTPKFLAISVMGLGAGMNLGVIAKVGLSGIGYTIMGILVTAFVGTLLGRLLKTEKDTSLLITVGTAICGGSAIAAVAPVIKAKPHEISVSLGTVFTLNAVALFIFPWIGHHLNLNQNQFGLWSALAIHDTSSVVGATLQYGTQALQVGTTVKLARALWIIPVTLIVGFIRSRKNKTESRENAKRPWFILGFLIAAALVTWLPTLQPVGHIVESLAKHLMVLTLFLIGSSLSRETLQAVGFKPFVQGICLWAVIATSSLAAIYFNMI